MVRQGIAPLDPLHGGAQQHHPLLGPLSDAPRFGVTIVRRHRRGAQVLDEGGGLWIDDVTFGHCRGFNLHPFGKADAVVDEVQTLAIDPAVISAFAPGGIRIEMAELGGNPPSLAVALVPDGPLGLKQAFIGVEILTGELGVEVFGILPQKGNKVLQDGVESLIAPRQSGTVGYLVESNVLAQLRVVLEPAMLGFEAKGPPLLHDHEEHEQGLLLVDKRPSAMRASRLLLPKAFKQRKQQLDIVGKGRCDHGRTSWRTWQLSSKRPAYADYVNALCTPLNYLRKLLVHGARATIRWVGRKTDRRSQWIRH